MSSCHVHFSSHVHYLRFSSSHDTPDSASLTRPIGASALVTSDRCCNVASACRVHLSRPRVGAASRPCDTALVPCARDGSLLVRLDAVGCGDKAARYVCITAARHVRSSPGTSACHIPEPYPSHICLLRL